MSVDKWSIVDHGETAHWWLGRDGTACGRDFRIDVHAASQDDPRCDACRTALFLPFHRRADIAARLRASFEAAIIGPICAACPDCKADPCSARHYTECVAPLAEPGGAA